MASPQPVTLVSGDNPNPSLAPQPLIVVDLIDLFASVSGYDDEETQTLKHVSGVLTWVTDV